MLRIWRPSGQELTALSAEEFRDADAVKKHLRELYGFPVYLQQLLHAGKNLADDFSLDNGMDLQVVLLTISGFSHSGHSARIAAQDLADAARRNDVNMVRCLLDAGADKEFRVGDKTALMLASELGHLEVVHLLLEARADTDSWDNFGRTALLHASESGHLAIVRLLLEAGADKDCWNTVGETALLLASEGGHLEVARLLLEAGANKDCTDLVGKTALLRASESGHSEIARLLVEAGADKDCKDLSGMTALLLAAEGGHSEVARLLLDADVGKDIPEVDDGWTA